MPNPADRKAAKLALDRSADARSRGVRTFVQVALVELVVTVVPAVTDWLDGDTFDGADLVRASVRAALGAVLAIAMRYAVPPP